MVLSVSEVLRWVADWVEARPGGGLDDGFRAATQGLGWSVGAFDEFAAAAGWGSYREMLAGEGAVGDWPAVLRAAAAAVDERGDGDG